MENLDTGARAHWMEEKGSGLSQNVGETRIDTGAVVRISGELWKGLTKRSEVAFDNLCSGDAEKGLVESESGH